jgi:hypothetical protein
MFNGIGMNAITAIDEELARPVPDLVKTPREAAAAPDAGAERARRHVENDEHGRIRDCGDPRRERQRFPSVGQKKREPDGSP